MTRLPIALPCLLLVGGCVPYGDPEEPDPPMDVPEQYAAGDEEPAPRQEPLGAREQRWWLVFGDAGLNQLEERALAGSFSMGTTWARLAQARANVRQAAAPRYPQVIPQAEASWLRSDAGFFTGQTTLGASVPVTYEVDWFAKYEGQAQAAEYDAVAARAQVGSAAITLTANVAEAWYNLVEARAREDLLEEQIELNETYLELTLLRFRQGLTSALDAHQQRQQVAATRAQLALVVAQTRVLENQVAVLVGAMPSQPVAPPRDELPEVPPLPRTGVPADLLVNRPDVRAAMQRVRAADERAAAAVANHLPSLVLSASAGYQWQKEEFGGADDMGGTGGGIQGSTTSHGARYTAGATLSIPLFDGFQRKAQIDLQRAQLWEAMEGYGQAVQQAMLEVSNAVAQERQQLDRIEHLEEQLQAANDALESARDRYRQGLTGFLNVLTALQAQQQTELTLLAARRQLLSYRIQIHRALGGTWTAELEEPEPRTTQ